VKITVDSNVLVRSAVRDDVTQANAADGAQGRLLDRRAFGVSLRVRLGAAPSLQT
jgi:hypothetical protein